MNYAIAAPGHKASPAKSPRKGESAVDSREDELLLPNPVKQFIIPILAMAALMGTFVSFLLINARHEVWIQAIDSGSRVAVAVESDLSRTFESIDLSLQAVAEGMKRPDILTMERELRNSLLFDRSATARHLGAVYVLNSAGNFQFDSRTTDPAPINVSDRDYFKVHRDNDAIGLYISEPFVTRQTKDLSVAVSRRLSNSDGTFSGVAVSTLRLSSLQRLFKDITVSPGSNITLSRTDGIVLMRWPYRTEYVGLDIKNAEIFRHLLISRSGSFETVTKIDNVRRLVSYSQIGNFPLVVGFGQNSSHIYKVWESFATSMIVSTSIFIAFSATLLIGLYRASEKTREAKARLLASNRGLQHFTSIIAHDLRSPLTRIEAFIAMLRDGVGKSKTDREKEIFSRIVYSAARMKLMLDSMLDYTRYNLISTEGKSTDIAKVVRDVIENSDFGEVEAKISLKLRDDLRVKGDPMLLAHVFQNLIGNSIKFRRSDVPNISIETCELGDKVLVSLTDDGIGIEPQYADNVFEMFARLHNEDEYQGVGLGLSVCRKIVNDHGGAIWVDKDFTSGTRMTFTLQKADPDC